MISAAQIRAARALLGLSQQELALMSGVGIATIKRLETQASMPRGNLQTFAKLKSALEEAGIIFLEAGADVGSGVRLVRPD